jgi:hypothetical protein
LIPEISSKASPLRRKASPREVVCKIDRLLVVRGRGLRGWDRPFPRAPKTRPRRPLIERQRAFFSEHRNHNPGLPLSKLRTARPQFGRQKVGPDRAVLASGPPEQSAWHLTPHHSPIDRGPSFRL